MEKQRIDIVKEKMEEMFPDRYRKETRIWENGSGKIYMTVAYAVSPRIVTTSAVIDSGGDINVEMENIKADIQRKVHLAKEDMLINGPALTGEFTAYIDSRQDALFLCQRHRRELWNIRYYENHKNDSRTELELNGHLEKLVKPDPGRLQYIENKMTEYYGSVQGAYNAETENGNRIWRGIISAEPGLLQPAEEET